MTSLEVRTVLKSTTFVELYYIKVDDSQERIWKKTTEVKDGQEKVLEDRFMIDGSHRNLVDPKEVHEYLVNFLHGIEDRQKEDMDEDDNITFTFTEEETVKGLMDRVVEAFRNKGHEVYWINHIRSEKVSSTLPHKTIAVLETFRMNHTELDNVTVTIEVQEWEGHSGRRIFKTKVPKNASDKVINNRVDKVIEVLNQ